MTTPTPISDYAEALVAKRVRLTQIEDALERRQWHVARALIAEDGNDNRALIDWLVPRVKP